MYSPKKIRWQFITSVNPVRRLLPTATWRSGVVYAPLGIDSYRAIPAVNLLMQWESGRQSCLKIDLFSGDGVVEFQVLGVQEISSIAREAGEIFKRLAG